MLRKSLHLFVALIVAVTISLSRAQAQTYTESVVYSFCTQVNCSDGSYPNGSLIQASNGNIYGTTLFGGNGGTTSYGTLFKLAPGGALTTLYRFCSKAGCADGELPNSGLVEGGDGNFYGTTYIGGAHGDGTVFRLTPAGALTTLYSFCSLASCADGALPPGGLIQGSDGDFYGLTDAGGSYNGGLIFKISSSGTLTRLYSFCSQNAIQSPCTDGEEPLGTLLQGSNGNFYGTTSRGGIINSSECDTRCGTFFEITPGGTFTSLYSFCGQMDCADGEYPGPGLVEGSTGNLFGTVDDDGNSEDTSLFDYSGEGVQNLCTPDNCSSTLSPVGPLLVASDRNMYGVAGASGFTGALFQEEPLYANLPSSIYNFCGLPGCTNGYYPSPGLLQANDGNFYGATLAGGTSTGTCEYNDCGTIFKLAVSPALPAPVQLTLSSSAVTVGSSTTLTFTSLNAFSTTMQQCYAFVNGTPLGKVPATYNSSTLRYTYQVAIAPTAAGVYNYAVTCGGIESGLAALTVAGHPTKTTLTASPSTVTPPEQVALTAMVTRTGSSSVPSGTVTFYYGTTSLGSAKLNGSGVATLEASSRGVPAGTYGITAKYGGDSADAGSTSTGVNVTVK
jgi:uncharacterized repeat protein (TIGR03803 family)